MTNLTKYVEEVGELPRDILLGHMVIFTIRDGHYDLDRVGKLLDKHQLNPSFQPEKNRPVDAFKKAITKNDEHQYTDTCTGNTVTILMRPVATDTTRIVQHLIREERDASNAVLSHIKVGEATFYKAVKGAGPNSWRHHFYPVFNALDELYANREEPYVLSAIDVPTRITDGKAHEVAAIKNLVATMEGDFDTFHTYADSMKIRYMVREYLKYLHSIQVKPSVYFCHADRMDEVTRLQTMIGELKTDSTLHMIPLVNLAEQRQMIIKAFEDEAVQTLTNFVRDVQELKAARKTVSPDAFAKMRDKYTETIELAKEYTTKLDLAQDRTAGAAELALAALHDLQVAMVKSAEAGVTT